MLEENLSVAITSKKPKRFLKMPFPSQLADKKWLQSPDLLYTIGLPCSSPGAVWKRFKIPTILWLTQSPSENVVFLKNYPKKNSTPSASTKQIRTRYTCSGNTKTISENK